MPITKTGLPRRRKVPRISSLRRVYKDEKILLLVEIPTKDWPKLNTLFMITVALRSFTKSIVYKDSVLNKQNHNAIAELEIKVPDCSKEKDLSEKQLQLA